MSKREMVKLCRTLANLAAGAVRDGRRGTFGLSASVWKAQESAYKHAAWLVGLEIRHWRGK